MFRARMPWRRRRYICQLGRRILLSFLLCGLFAVPAEAAEKGVVTDLTWGTSSGDQDRTAAAISDLGARWAQLHLDWAAAEPSQGTYDAETFATLDRAIALAHQAGANVNLIVLGTPTWESGSTEAGVPPKDPDNYASFLSYVVARYKGQVQSYEIWNEENDSRFWSTGPDASEYAELLKAAYPAVKSADPDALVVFGGLALSDYDYVDAAYAAAPDIGSYFDVMAVHPYSPDAPETIRYENGRIAADSFAGYREVRASMLAHGTSKPIWLTEFGWSTNSGPAWHVTEAQQADYLTRAYAFLAQDPYVQVALWYNLRNHFWENDANTWGAQLGLLRTDFSPKPAYAAFRAVNRPEVPVPSPQAETTVSSVNAAVTTTASPSTKRAPSRQKTSISVSVRSIPVRATGRASAQPRARLLGGFRVTGTVRNARTGRVIVYVQRLTGARPRWRPVLRLIATVNRSGRFVRTVSSPLLGRMRVRAAYTGAPTRAPSVSRFVYFRVTRAR